MPDTEAPELPPGELNSATHEEASGALDAYLGGKAPAETPPAPVETPAAPANTDTTDPLDGLQPPAPAAPAAPEPKPDDEPAPKHLNKEQATNWKTLRSEAKAAHEKAVAAEARAAELEAKLAEKADPEEVNTLRKTVEELEDKLAFFAIEQSPTFKAEFDAKIEAESSVVYDALKTAGVDAATLDKYREADAVKTQNLAFWDRVTTHLRKDPKTETLSLKIEAAVRNARRIQGERDEALKDPAKLQAFGSKAAQAITEKAAADEKFLLEFVAEAQKSHPWAKAVEVKATATPAEKAAAEAHNVKHERYKSVFVKAIESDDVKIRAKIGMAAIQALEFQAENQRLTQALAQKESELAKLKGASPKAAKDSVAPGTKPASTKADALPEIDLDDSREALEKRLTKFQTAR